MQEVRLSGCGRLSSLALAQCKLLHSLAAEDSAALAQLNAFGCRALSAESLAALLRVCAASLTSLDLNGCLRTEPLSEEDLRRRCPALTSLDLRGRRLKH